MVCQTLGQSRSTFYAYSRPTPPLPAAQDEPLTRQDADASDTRHIHNAFINNAGRYGYRRIQAELQRQGIFCGHGRVRRLMGRAGLCAARPRSHCPRTSDGKASAPSPNLLQDRDLPAAPNQVWATDITYIPIQGGWVYLVIIIDLFSRKIVGWSLANHMRSSLVINALQRSIFQRNPPPGLILHSDRGSQFGSHAFRHALNRIAARQSMSAPGNPYHNAFVESAFSRLKTELLQGGCFCDIQDAHLAIFDFIEVFYNQRRLHSSIGYIPPQEFENAYWLNINSIPA